MVSCCSKNELENLTTNVIFKTDTGAASASYKIKKLSTLLLQMDEMDDSSALDVDMYGRWFRQHFGDMPIGV